jgi:hypothetical protein
MQLDATNGLYRPCITTFPRQICDAQFYGLSFPGDLKGRRYRREESECDP